MARRVAKRRFGKGRKARTRREQGNGKSIAFMDEQNGGGGKANEISGGLRNIKCVLGTRKEGKWP